MEDKDFFDLCFITLLSIRFHPKNVSGDDLYDYDVRHNEIEACIDISEQATMRRDDSTFRSNL